MEKLGTELRNTNPLAESARTRHNLSDTETS